MRGETASYRVFGGVLRSELPFPGLPDGSGRSPDWTLQISSSRPDMDGLTEWGCEAVESDVDVRLLGGEGVLRLEYDDTGTFDVVEDGRSIVWYPPEGDVDRDAVRKDVIGRVMAVALHRAGRVTLHGSGVLLGEAAVGFLAPKFHGKSTTAAALVRAGGRLLSDDILPVEVENGRAMVYPGVPTMNLRLDSAQRVAVDTSGFEPQAGRPKMSVTWSDDEISATKAPLSALYLLRPTDGEDVSVGRALVSGAMAPLALLGQSKIGLLLGPGRAEALLDDMVRVAETVPLYTLTIPRGLHRVDELVAALHAWHLERPAATSR